MEVGAIQFEVLSLDDGDGLVNLSFKATNGSFSAAQGIWDYADAFVPFAGAASKFPQKSGDNPLLELGSMEERSAYYIRVRAYMFDAVGHAAIEVVVDNRREGEHLARAAFQIHCEIAAINRLGNDLLKWYSDQSLPFTWKSIDNKV